jgi:hypothetical protein
VITIDRIPATTSRRSVMTSLLLVIAFVCGPLAFSPALAVASSVSGRVVDSGGSPVEDAWIGVYERNEEDETYYGDEALSTYTDASGRYSLDLAPGTYKLYIEGDDDRLVSEYYDDADRLSRATPVVVRDDAQTLNDIELELLPTIQGTISADDGGAVRSGYVVAYQWEDGFGWDGVDSADTDANGRYALSLDPGTYRIGFFDEAGELVPEYWKDAARIDQARDVAVSGAGVTGIDAALTRVPVRRGAFTMYQRPRIGNYAAVGQVVSSTDGTWTPAPATTARQWLRDGAPIPGATGSMYRATRDDAGRRLSLQVTVSSPSHGPMSTVTASTDPVRWTSRIAVSSKAGKKRATLKIRVTSAGGVPTGKVVIKERYKLVKVVWLKGGKATVTLKKLKKKQRYTFHYYGSPATYASSVSQSVKTKTK